MGASFNCRTYDNDLGEKQILAKFNADCEESRYESGHSYSGEIGMLRPPCSFEDKQFPDERAADDHVSNNQEKWEPAMAVSYIDKNQKKRWLIGGWCSS